MIIADDENMVFARVSRKKIRKVLLVAPEFKTSNLCGKSEKIMTRVIEFQKNGWDVILFSIRNKGQSKHEIIQLGTGEVKVFRFEVLSRLLFGYEKRMKGNSKFSSVLNFLFDVSNLPIVSNMRALLSNHSISKSALKEARNIDSKECFDVIYASNMPNSMLTLGARIKKVTGKPLISEFREPWTENSHFSSYLDFKYERQVLDASDVIVTYEGVQMTYDHLKKYHNLPKCKFMRLRPIGYYPEHFMKIKTNNSSKFSISYGGSLFGIQNPITFLKGLSLFIKKNQIAKKDIEITFMGSWSSKYQKLANRLGISEYLRVLPYVEHSEYLRILASSTLLLLLVETSGKKSELSLPSKLWEYVALSKPILLLGKDNWVSAKYLKKNNLGLTADAYSPQDIFKKINIFYQKYKRNNMHYGASADLKKTLDRKEVIRHFCNIMEVLAK